MKQKLLLVLLGLLFLNLGPLCHVASAQTSSVSIYSLTNGQTVYGNSVFVAADYTIAPGYQTGGGSSGLVRWTRSDGVWYSWLAYQTTPTGSGKVGCFCNITTLPNGVYTVEVQIPCMNSPTYQYIKSPPITVYVQNPVDVQNR